MDRITRIGEIEAHNILTDSYNRYKLADFGLSQKYQPNTTSTQFPGSPMFMAPEIIAKLAFDPFMADLWSFGVTFPWMASGANPWGAKVEIMQALLCGIPVLPSNIADPDFRHIMRLMGEIDPSNRISVHLRAVHPLFQPAVSGSSNTDGKSQSIASLRSFRCIRQVERGFPGKATASRYGQHHLRPLSV
jgi:serine/threonine protein kinase